MSRLAFIASLFILFACTACGGCGGGGGGGSGGSGDCEPPRQTCGDACVDPATDQANCGACGAACPTGAVCEAGTCRDPVCPGALGLPGPARLEFGTWTRDAILVDFDGDGDLDLFASQEAPPGILEFRNDAGVFRPAAALPALGAGRMAAGDLDGDGTQDLIVGDETTTLLLGADPTHAIDQENLGLVFDVVPADFDGDGDLDFAILSAWNGDTVVFLHDNDGGPPPFQRTVVVDGLAIDRNAMAADDFTGDGRIDLAITSAAGKTLYLFPGTGPGTFADPDAIPLPREPEDVVLADVDGDRSLDVVLTAGMILRGDGAGGFRSAVDVVAAAPDCERLQVIDLDADGRPEVLCGARGGGVWLGRNVGGTLEDGGIVPAASREAIPLAADLGGGRVDLLVATPGHAVRLPADGSEVDRPFVVREGMGRLPATAPAMAQGDLDGDGDLDVLFVPGGGTELALFRGGPLGLEDAEPVDGPAPAAVTLVATGDLDGDGTLEFVTWAETLGSLVVARIEGGVPIERSRLPVAGTVVALAAADVDGDGRDDVVALAQNPDAATVYWGAGGTATAPFPTSPRAVVAADLDGDGRAEVVIGGWQEALLVRGDRAAGLVGVPAFAAGASALAAGDLDDDGVLEVALLAPDQDRVAVLGVTGGGLEERGSLPLDGAGPSAMAVADLDGDRRRDVIIASLGTGGLHLLRGRGDGTVELGPVWTAFLGDTQGAPPPALALVQLPGDHRTDVLVADWHEGWLLKAVCLP